MVKRYTVLQQFIPQTDLDLMPYLLTVDENSQVQGLLINLEQIESVTKVLQEEDQPVTLSDIRDLFDALIEEFPAMTTHLAKNAVIVANRCFEDAVVKCIENKFQELTEDEKNALKAFEKQVIEGNNSTGSNFAKGLLQAKRLKTGGSGYVSLQWVPGTSNVCERLFSRAKLNIGYLRHNMSPMHVEAELFLCVNKEYWDAELISKILWETHIIPLCHFFFILE